MNTLKIFSICGVVYVGDLYEPLPAKLRGRVEFLVANTPYVPTEAIKLLPQDTRLHEPIVALDGGIDGLDIQRRVAEKASLWLAAGGHLLVETSEMQAHLTFEIFSQNGLIPQIRYNPEIDATIVIGTKPNPLNE
ncbi:hypothetical protein GCM10007199_30270 [Fictibacillus barbaricus]|uniref:Uncharacterized protein n=1 Tax=Fictibacillus barbaricus TaxID=182136 RepID=A0ABS2ZCM6_9BACL|nr:hypothetical protein [Fictibacillus barbaricus]GGB62291.1 hypothetical protein GCM10007199_30270 [Fictibacillus barbaricus]